MTEEDVPTDWAALRTEAEKLGISLSDLQQKKRQQKLLNAAKSSRFQASPKQEPNGDSKDAPNSPE
jgi:hypothetical protein